MTHWLTNNHDGLKNAVTRSITHTERVHVDYAGSYDDLLAALRDIDPDCGDAIETDGTVDVWGGSGSEGWRLCVSVRVVVGPLIDEKGVSEAMHAEAWGDALELFRQDNTRGYTDAELFALNAEWQAIVDCDNLEPGTDEYHHRAKQFADEVSRRVD